MLTLPKKLTDTPRIIWPNIWAPGTHLSWHILIKFTITVGLGTYLRLYSKEFLCLKCCLLPPDPLHPVLLAITIILETIFSSFKNFSKCCYWSLPWSPTPHTKHIRLALVPGALCTCYQYSIYHIPLISSSYFCLINVSPPRHRPRFFKMSYFLM